MLKHGLSTCLSTVRALPPSSRSARAPARPFLLDFLDRDGAYFFESLVPPQAILAPVKLLADLAPESSCGRARDVENTREFRFVVGRQSSLFELIEQRQRVRAQHDQPARC